ncbi:hypothetical protein Lfu02_54320 [Longispora fulva]|uniref:Uncharacterized protein n=1 Tax=Longispora fulva TaxID=619741 RepID=A0A8J7GJ55_9ACTN|nr:hypothetical protein [Longispora fulva]MBG6137585.1 hypothetical protein [Longispora fulva]GIG61060.1 hypothetical protein Lfu02_54320 [Longispora fulva]
MLERRYRALLRAYPEEFRAERGEELVATLLDGARPGQTRPTLADVSDMLGSGLRRRLGLDRHAGAEVGLRRVAPVAVVLLAVVSTVVLYRASPGGEPVPLDIGENWWEFGVAAGWLAAVLAWAVLPRAAGRIVLGATLAATVVGQFATGVVPVREQGVVLHQSMEPHTFGTFVLLGVLALCGTRDLAASVAGRVALVAAGAGVVVGTGLWTRGLEQDYVVIGRLGFSWTLVLPAVLALGALAVLVGVGVRSGRARGGGWLWAAVLLLVPAMWLAMQVLGYGYGDGTLAILGMLRGPVSPLVLLVAVGVLVVALRWGAPRALGAGSVTTAVLGVGAAFSAVLLPYHAGHGERSILLGYVAVLLAAVAWRWWPVATPYLVVAASAVFLIWAVRHPDRAELALAGSVLAPVALTGVRDRPARPAVWPAAVAALLAAPLVFSTGDLIEITPASFDGWTLETGTLLTYLALDLPQLVIVPCAMAVLVGADRVTRAARGWGWALVGLAGGGTWFVLVTVRSITPAVVALTVAAGAGLLLARRFRARTVGSVTDTGAVS